MDVSPAGEAEETNPEDTADNDLDESSLTGAALIEKELGGKLIEEIDHTD